MLAQGLQEVGMRFARGWHEVCQVCMRFTWRWHKVSTRFAQGWHEVSWGWHKVGMRFARGWHKVCMRLARGWLHKVGMRSAWGSAQGLSEVWPNSKTKSDCLFPHHPIPNAKFQPITLYLNRPTYHKSAKVSLPPFPGDLLGTPIQWISCLLTRATTKLFLSQFIC